MCCIVLLSKMAASDHQAFNLSVSPSSLFTVVEDLGLVSIPRWPLAERRPLIGCRLLSKMAAPLHSLCAVQLRGNRSGAVSRSPLFTGEAQEVAARPDGGHTCWLGSPSPAHRAWAPGATAMLRLPPRSAQHFTAGPGTSLITGRHRREGSTHLRGRDGSGDPLLGPSRYRLCCLLPPGLLGLLPNVHDPPLCPRGVSPGGPHSWIPPAAAIPALLVGVRVSFRRHLVPRCRYCWDCFLSLFLFPPCSGILLGLSSFSSTGTRCCWGVILRIWG